MSKVAVIMRAKNSDWVIDQTLAALFSQEEVDFTLYLVDSGSRDQTLAIAKRYPCEITRIRPEEYYPGPVLNNAIQGCSEERLLFLNSDAVLLSPLSAKRLLDELDKPDCMAAFGRQVARPEAAPWVQRDYEECFPYDPTGVPWLPFSLVFSAMRRDAWEAAPFYDAAWGSEDVAWAVANGGVNYCPKATCMHSHNYSLKELWGRGFIEGEADAFIYQRRNSLAQAAARATKATLRDIRFCIRERALYTTPLHRWSTALAYHQGHAWGAKRQREGIDDPRLGQERLLRSRGQRS